MEAAVPEASVIVSARNAAATVGATVAALAAQDADVPYEVIVVDNGSTDDTAEIVARAGSAVRLVRKEPSRVGEARNRGVAAARGNLLAFTDSDCVPEPDWLRAGVRALADSDLVQGRVLPDPAAVRTPFDRSVTIQREYGLYETANLFVRRELFERLDGFEDWLPERVVSRPLGEDVWFAWRARRAGARTAFCDDALVHHAVFERTAAEYVAERLRLAYFPAMAAKIPELREAFLYRRWFLSRRTAAFDLAVGAALMALCSGRTARLAAALAAAPYLRDLLAGARRGGRRRPAVATADLAADAVGLGALVAGSVRFRSPVL
jgi:glycosyltransferase involved in cell wall biosynthesis